MAYLPLSTANLPDPVIDPAQDASPEDYFNTVLYTGNGGTLNVTGVGFQPDWVWLKMRTSSGYDHILQDAVRGSTKQLISHSTAAEVDDTDAITSFDADGFTSGADVTTNTSGSPYVAWNWKANGSGVSNTDGTITSTVSANTESGFSIVSYTGTGANATVGHGLSTAPDMLIVKSRTQTGTSWLVYHSANTTAPETEGLFLNLTDATLDNNVYWNDTAPTSSVFSVGTAQNTNKSGENLIAYCFHSVEGFSKFGSYTGNGSADGPFVYTGFRPSWIMIKRTDSAESWSIIDSVRDEYNLSAKKLYANASGVEDTGTTYGVFDALSNGFKLRASHPIQNASGGTYIFAAFAEQPFRYSNAR